MGAGSIPRPRQSLNRRGGARSCVRLHGPEGPGSPDGATGDRGRTARDTRSPVFRGFGSRGIDAACSRRTHARQGFGRTGTGRHGQNGSEDGNPDPGAGKRSGPISTYTFSDGSEVVFHNGPKKIYVELLGRNGRRIARVASIENNMPEWETVGQRELRQHIYEMAKSMRPKTKEDLASLRDFASSRLTATGGAGILTPTSTTARGSRRRVA
jgi:hypothetical protein